MKPVQQLFFLCLLFLAAACQTDTPTDTTTETDASDNMTVATSPTHVTASDIAPFVGLWEYSKPVARDLARQN